MNQTNKQIVISASHLTLGYGKNLILENITVDIYSGEFIGIFGQNGSGKSTFFRAVLGLIKPHAGRLMVLGKESQGGHQKIGYMPQMRSHISIAHLTSRSLLETTFNGTRYGLPFLSSRQKANVQKVLEKVGAESFADRPFHQLSGGERQRIFLAQSLLDDPLVLLLDEPLANLDPQAQENFINLLCRIQMETNVTILFSAHDPNPLLDVMTRALYFAQKQAVIGTIKKIMTSEVLSALYGMPIEVVHFKDRLFVLGEGRHIREQESPHHD